MAARWSEGWSFPLAGGTAKVYATCWDRMVRIKASREIYLLSPAEPEAFVEAANLMATKEKR
ncbi:MAG: PH domain-containing protein [Bacillota bacterium]